jgi:hypothetical protein
MFWSNGQARRIRGRLPGVFYFDVMLAVCLALVKSRKRVPNAMYSGCYRFTAAKALALHKL